MEPLVLTDRSVVPDDQLIRSIIGENYAHWETLIQVVREKYPDAESVWKYYNDGKSWLFRMIRKKKTLFWIGVLKDTFRITFYFGDKAENLIESSDLPEGMKAGFKNGKALGKLRAITILVGTDEDIDHALRLTEIRVTVA